MGRALPPGRREGAEGGGRLEAAEHGAITGTDQTPGELAAAWAAFLKTNPADDKDAFRKAWMEARKGALAKAGMDPIFE